jgi:glucan phosphoethanolaminetransferase (alkaline phosphatase superfamily)
MLSTLNSTWSGITLVLKFLLSFCLMCLTHFAYLFIFYFPYGMLEIMLETDIDQIIPAFLVGT